MSIRAVSYGGGVQSTALLVLAAQQRIEYPLFLMANVGDDSEHPATLKYVREIATPYAEAHGIELVILDRHRADGSIETLYGRLTKPGGRSLPIPSRSRYDGPPMSRACTADFKRRVTGKELKRRGAAEQSPATVALGISLDEIHRANDKKVEPHERVVYPLISVGDDTGLRLRRADCQQIIARAGLPVPPKSSCWFCPLHKEAAWVELARDEPDLFDRACQLEKYLNDRDQALGRRPVFLSRLGKPLREAIHTDQELLPLADANAEGCDSGWCMT